MHNETMPSAPTGQRIYSLASAGRFDGVICLSGTLIGDIQEMPALEQLLQPLDIPVISLGVKIADQSSVTVNDLGAMQDLMRHLLSDHSRQQFAFVQGKINDSYSMAREQVFRDMLAMHGHDVKPQRVVCGNYDTVESYRVVYELLRNDPDVDVLVAANDMMALSAAKAASALGISVPQELLISGFDDTPDATRHAPAITTVRQPLLQMADRSVSTLLDHIEASRNKRSITIRHTEVDSELIVRGSTVVADHTVTGDELVSAQRLENQLQSLMSGLAAPGEEAIQTVAQALWETLHNAPEALQTLITRELEDTINHEHIHWWTNLCHQIETLAAAHLNRQDRIHFLPQITAAIAPVKERIWSMNMDREFEIRRLQSVQSAIQLQLSACTEIDQILSILSQWLANIEARRFYLARFEAPSPEPHLFANVIQSYANGQVTSHPEQYFRSRLLLPADSVTELSKGLLVMVPVFAGEDLFGYVLLDPRGLNRLRLNAAANAIGNAMRNRFLISELEKQTNNLQSVNHDLFKLANFDALTGLPNRLSFQRYLQDNCVTALRNRESMCLLFIDLDGFKLVNDTLGHAAGDLLLKTVAVRLNAVVDDYPEIEYFIARLGGDEFTMVLTGESPDTVVHRINESLLESISTPFALGDEMVNVSASIGFAFFPTHGNSASEILKSADMAMYRAKELGKNRVAVYTPDMRVENLSLHEQANALREALQSNRLQMYYQPRIDLVSGEVCGVEALMRWIDPEADGHHFVGSPDEFIPVAERSGLINEVDAFALESACAQSHLWQLSGQEIVISVNVSVLTLQHDDFIGLLTRMLQKYDVRRNQLELEITESGAMRKVEENLEKLGRVRALGVGLSIDDFGTGFSSLNYLKQLPVNNLKIDRSLISGINSDPDTDGVEKSIVRSVAVLGASMDFGLIAEGVETHEQLAFVKSVGCQQAQGNYFSAALPAQEIASQWFSSLKGKAA